MTDASIIDEVEGHYRSYLAGGDECAGCGQIWPCLTQRLVAEVQRLRKELDEARVTIRAMVHAPDMGPCAPASNPAPSGVCPVCKGRNGCAAACPRPSLGPPIGLDA